MHACRSTLEDPNRGLAQTALAELLEAAPDYVPALERAAAFAAARDPQTHAAALLRYAGALDRSDAELVAAAARKLRDAGDHEAAVRQFERAVAIDEAYAGELDGARAELTVARACKTIDTLLANGELDKAGGQIDQLLSREQALPDAAIAQLTYRQATAQARLGDADEAHRLLHEAFRHDRRDLAITLALGESCYERRLWREAARYLGSLADHADAGAQAAGVAMGLVHAALSETRSLRPGNAVAHLEAAVRIDPTCGPAWHALAEAAIEKGDLARAADCLEREATSTPDLQHRVRLFDALGDMARDVLGDAARAERCWFEVVGLADAPVLHKLLALQRKSTSLARGSRATTCLRLAELEPDSRKQLREEAAQVLIAAGEIDRAMEVATQLVGVHPHDLDAATIAADVAIAARDPRRVAGWLRRTLAAQHASHHAPRVAALWRKLGDAEQALGDAHAARSAYRRAVIVAPDSDGALAARRGLVDLSSDQRSETAAVALQSSLFALVEAEPEANDALALAHQLSSNKLEDARATYELARVLGASLSADDEQFYADHPPRAMAPDEAYATRLEDAARRELIDDPDDGPLADIFELLGEVGSLVCPDTRSAILELDAERIPVTGDVAAASMLPQITKALGGPLTMLYASPRVSRVATILAAPPAIVLGPELLVLRAPARSRLAPIDDASLRFQLGRAVELARWRRLFSVDRDELTRWVATLEAFAGRETSPGAQRDAERLRSKLPVTHRKRLSDRLAAATLDADRYFSACQRAADRAGLLACGDISVAVELAGGPDSARHLVSLAATRPYLATRRRLRNRDAEDVTNRFSLTQI